MRIEDRAAFLLRHPEDAGLGLLIKGRRLVLRIIHEPAFTAHRSWSLYAASRDDSRLLLLRLTREPSVDPIDPKLVNRVSYLEANAADELLAEGAAIRIPPIVLDAALGLDGEFWNFEGGDFFWNTKLCWWCEGPPAWKALDDWTRRLTAFLDAQG